ELSPHDALWLSEHGSAMTEIAIYFRIREVTRAHFGHAIHPHLFRDSAATSIAIDDPEHVWMIKNVLGHSSLATSERHYIQAQMLQASRRYQQTVLARRRQACRHDRG